MTSVVSKYWSVPLIRSLMTSSCHDIIANVTFIPESTIISKKHWWKEHLFAIWWLSVSYFYVFLRHFWRLYRGPKLSNSPHHIQENIIKCFFAIILGLRRILTHLLIFLLHDCQHIENISISIPIRTS